MLTKRIQVSEHFYLDEYVRKDFYQKWGAKCVHWIRPEVIKVDQALRYKFGVTEINDWWDGGKFDDRGFRYPITDTGATDSFHKFGCASDKVFINASAEEVRKYIIANENYFMNLGLTTIEDNVSWVHTDCRNTGLNHILIL